MCTKRPGPNLTAAPGNPFKSPYDAFVTYNNVVKDFADALDAKAAATMAEAMPEPLWFQPVVASYWPRRSYARPRFA
jgi:hypothetical protein